MEAMNDNKGLSAENLKSQLYQSLHSSGLLKQLKGQLRQSMINELRGKGDKKFQSSIKSNRSDLLATTIRQKKSSSSWVHQAIDNLVYLHLKQNGYQYCLSLFEQEATVDSFSPAMMDDLMQRLGLHSSDLDISADTPASSISEDFSYLSSTPNQKRDHGLALWIILDKLSSFAVSKPSPKQVEKVKLAFDEDKPQSLGEKLKAIDEEMDLKAGSIPRDPAVNINTYTAAVRKAEEDAERRAKAHFEQWKSLELVTMKMEESKRSKYYVDARLRELEQDYQSKREALQSRERGAISRLQHQREMLEREMHDQRQSLLREIDQIRMREEALHKQEQAIHEIELLKRDELKLMQREVGKSMGKQNKKQESPVPKTATQLDTTDFELKKVRNELKFKSDEMEKLKIELSLLKVELSNAKRFNQTQASRENLLLKSHLDQLTREIQSNKNSPRESKSSLVEEQLRQEVKKLTEERSEQDAQQRSLAQALKDMQQALEDSNAAIARFNSRPTTANPTNQQKATPNVNDVISSYSPAPKRDTLREYEPVQSGLHPGLYSSGEFDDLSTDERAASASVRLDLLQRLRDLEEQTYAVDEHYHRYLKTHYRNIDAQIANQCTRSSPAKLRDSSLSKNEYPSSPHKSVYKASDRGLKNSPTKSSTSHPDQVPLFSKPVYKVGETHIDKEIEILLTSPSHHGTSTIIRPDLEDASRFSLEREAPVRDESVSSSTPSEHDNSLQKSSDLQSDDKSGFKKNSRIDSSTRDQSVSDRVKLPMESLGGSKDDEATVSSETSSLGSFSPKLDTARRANIEKEEKKLDDVTPSQNLQHIVAPRKLPSLPPSKHVIPSSQQDPGLSKPSALFMANISPHKLDPINVSDSVSVDATPLRSAVKEDDLVRSFPRESDGKKMETDKESREVSVSEHLSYSNEPASPALLEPTSLTPRNLPQTSEQSENTRSPSAVSEMSLPSFSNNSNSNPLLSLDQPKVKNESSVASESISGRRNPVAGGAQAHYSSVPASSEDSVGENVAAKNNKIKTWDDFDLSNEEGIAAALRYSDAHQPVLNFSDDEVVEKAPEAPGHQEQEKHEEWKEDADVFEMTDEHELDSMSSGKEGFQEVRSDVSW